LKKETVIIVIMGLVIVALGGFLLFKLSGKNEEPASSGAIPPPGSGSPMEYQQRIAELEKIVANNPKNLQAWTMLANEYYDTDQPQKAIDAYDKALGLSPDSPNLLTDQGVMYKRLGEINRALSNFEKAQKIDPKHLQSLYNIGIIYAEDLKQPENALKAWRHFLELDSTSPAAQQVKRMIAQTEASIGKSGKK
jgi:cytochrome c-type biogenesis protein CcmH/NrfG